MRAALLSRALSLSTASNQGGESHGRFFFKARGGMGSQMCFSLKRTGGGHVHHREYRTLVVHQHVLLVKDEGDTTYEKQQDGEKKNAQTITTKKMNRFALNSDSGTGGSKMIKKEISLSLSLFSIGRL